MHGGLSEDKLILTLSPRVISAFACVFPSCESLSGAKALAETQIGSALTPLSLPSSQPCVLYVLV